MSEFKIVKQSAVLLKEAFREIESLKAEVEKYKDLYFTVNKDLAFKLRKAEAEVERLTSNLDVTEKELSKVSDIANKAEAEVQKRMEWAKKMRHSYEEELSRLKAEVARLKSHGFSCGHDEKCHTLHDCRDKVMKAEAEVERLKVELVNRNTDLAVSHNEWARHEERADKAGAGVVRLREVMRETSVDLVGIACHSHSGLHCDDDDCAKRLGPILQARLDKALSEGGGDD